MSDAVARATRCEGATPRDEVIQALAWARDLALAEPGATIGIAIEDLESRREEVRALADEILCPSLQWPGHEDDARPYNLSLGAAPATFRWSPRRSTSSRSRTRRCRWLARRRLLRSPYVAGAPDDWLDRARLEADWLREGRSDISLDDASWR